MGSTLPVHLCHLLCECLCPGPMSSVSYQSATFVHVLVFIGSWKLKESANKDQWRSEWKQDSWNRLAAITFYNWLFSSRCFSFWHEWHEQFLSSHTNMSNSSLFPAKNNFYNQTRSEAMGRYFVDISNLKVLFWLTLWKQPWKSVLHTLFTLLTLLNFIFVTFMGWGCIIFCFIF